MVDPYEYKYLKYKQKYLEKIGSGLTSNKNITYNNPTIEEFHNKSVEVESYDSTDKKYSIKIKSGEGYIRLRVPKDKLKFPEENKEEVKQEVKEEDIFIFTDKLDKIKSGLNNVQSSLYENLKKRLLTDSDAGDFLQEFKANSAYDKFKRYVDYKKYKVTKPWSVNDEYPILDEKNILNVNRFKVLLLLARQIADIYCYTTMKSENILDNLNDKLNITINDYKYTIIGKFNIFSKDVIMLNLSMLNNSVNKIIYLWRSDSEIGTLKFGLIGRLQKERELETNNYFYDNLVYEVLKQFPNASNITALLNPILESGVSYGWVKSDKWSTLVKTVAGDTGSPDVGYNTFGFINSELQSFLLQNYDNIQQLEISQIYPYKEFLINVDEDLYTPRIKDYFLDVNILDQTNLVNTEADQLIDCGSIKGNVPYLNKFYNELKLLDFGKNIDEETNKIIDNGINIIFKKIIFYLQFIKKLILDQYDIISDSEYLYKYNTESSSEQNSALTLKLIYDIRMYRVQIKNKLNNKVYYYYWCSYYFNSTDKTYKQPLFIIPIESEILPCGLYKEYVVGSFYFCKPFDYVENTGFKTLQADEQWRLVGTYMFMGDLLETALI